MLQNDPSKDADCPTLRADDESRMLLWKYSKGAHDIVFFGRTGIEHFFGRSDESFSMSWEGFLDQSVHSEDRAKLEEKFNRAITDSALSSSPFPFNTDFRFKIFSRNVWISVSANGMVIRESANKTEIGGVILENKKALASTEKRTSEDFVQEITVDSNSIQNTPRHSNELRLFEADLAKMESEEARIRYWLDSLPFGCIVWDCDCNCIGCNRETLRLFDMESIDEFVKNLEKLSPEFQPSGRCSTDQLHDNIREAFSKGSLKYEWVHQNLTGQAIPVETILIRVRQEDRDYIVTYLRNLTELKKIQAERDQERHLLYEILNSSPICFTFLVDGHVQVISPYTTELLGIKVGDRLVDYALNTSDYDRLKEELKKQQKINWQPITVRSLHGDRKEMLTNVSYLDYGNEHGVIVWLIDVTEIRQVEADLRLARDAAEESARAKSEFLANMSHEIRTPMNAILGMTHLALRTDLTPQQLKYLESTEHSAKLLLRIINDILDFSKIEAGKMLMEYHEFSMTDVVTDLNSIVGESILNRGLIFSVDLSNDLPGILMGDSIRLRQVLVNLITNAIKFTDQGSSIVLSVRVDEQDMLSTTLHFEVTDTGIGMTPKQVKSLFRPFMQADTSTTRKYGGTGLGLAISKKIVELMKGNIWCESEVGKGTTFLFTARFGLPLEETVQTEEIRTDVLLLGDNHETLKDIRNYLELLKCKTVAQCETLDEFDRFLKRDRMNDVDFIIFDFNEIQHHVKPMVHELLSRFGNQLPPIYFTEHPGLDALIEEMGLSKPDRIIHKPIIVSELFDILVLLTEQKKKLLVASRKKSKNSVYNPVSHDVAASYIVPEIIKGARILLAEDNKINQMVATELLAMEGFSVDVVENGLEAVDKLKRNHYDLVLMDIQMPEMDGLEATRLIRSDDRFKNLPILAMTAHAISGDRELSLEAGMNDHITKPIDPKLLFQTLSKWIRKDN